MKTLLSITILAASVVLGVALVLSVLWFPFPSESDYITVGGQGQAPILPDGVSVYFTISARADSAAAAQESDATTFAAIQQAYSAAKLPGVIETTNYYLNKRTDYTSEGSVDRGYEVTHSFRVSAGVNDAASIIATTVQAGANGVDRIEYTISPSAKQAAAAEAMKSATLAAQQKAMLVTGSVRHDIGRVLKIEEGNWWVVPSNQPVAVPAIPGYSDSAVVPQQLVVETNVNVVFEVLS